MTTNTEQPSATDVAPETPPTTPDAPICASLSNRQSGKRIKAILKTDEIMDGSGHLYLKDPFKPLDNEMDAICSRTIAAFRQLNEVGEVINEERARIYIKSVLEMIFRPRRGKPLPPKQQQKPRLPRPQKPEPYKHNKPKPQKPQPQQQQNNRRQEVRVITVTVVKKRGFHYPLDLPAGAAGDES